MIRLFLGLAIPDHVRLRLLALRTGIRGARWQRDDQLHLTLKFIGEVDETVAEDIDAALAAVTVPDFQISLEGVGIFGPAKAPRMVWAGVKDGTQVIHLKNKIEAALSHIGIASEERKFIPHVTLARLSGGRNCAAGTAEFIAVNSGFQTLPFTVGQYILYASELSDSGSYYSVEASYPLY